MIVFVMPIAICARLAAASGAAMPSVARTSERMGERSAAMPEIRAVSACRKCCYGGSADRPEAATRRNRGFSGLVRQRGGSDDQSFADPRHSRPCGCDGDPRRDDAPYLADAAPSWRAIAAFRYSPDDCTRKAVTGLFRPGRPDQRDGARRVQPQTRLPQNAGAGRPGAQAAGDRAALLRGAEACREPLALRFSA